LWKVKFFIHLKTRGACILTNMGRLIPTHVRELQKNMDWGNPEWRNKFWALMAATVLPLLQRLDEAGRMSEATARKEGESQERSKRSPGGGGRGTSEEVECGPQHVVGAVGS
jgi:DNA-binding PadR family transcriptional regulator